MTPSPTAEPLALPTAYRTPAGVRITGEFRPEYVELLTLPALSFVTELHRHFDGRRQQLLARRAQRQREFAAGKLPDFLPDTQHLRDREWEVAPLPADLLDRRVEIAGPVDRKMIINALNSGAKVFMADLEDSNSPTWHNVVDGQRNLRDAVRRTIGLEANGKRYRLNPETAVLMVRPRGWHLLEKHVLVDGEPISGALLDFGLYYFHNAHELVRRGTGPYFYLPKLESHLEARLWNDVFNFAQDALTLIVARTDADAADLLTADVDERDQPFTLQEAERTSEGFYRIRCGVEAGIARGLSYAPYADLIWMETSHPDLGEARQFAEAIHRHYPGKLLAYNCSPSFNWASKLRKEQLETFREELAALGYKFQFITLAGFHALNTSMFELAQAYRARGMAGYSELQEREFALQKDGYQAVKHQAFVGTGYFDAVQTVVSAGRASTAALVGSTEEAQF